MTRAIVVKRAGAPVVLAQGSALLTSMTAQATRQANLAQSAASAALAAAGVGEYADTTAGLAGTSLGETFWVDLGNGLGQVYRHDAGPVATALQKFIIDPTAVLAFIESGEIDSVAIPPTSVTGEGVIYQDGVRLLHTFNDGTVVAGHVGGNAFGGLNSGNFTLSGVDNTGFGQDTLLNLTSASLSTMFGTRAGRAVTSGGVNSGFGVDVLASCATGEYNDGFGCKALTNTTTGSRNKAFGQSSLLYNQTGNDNCAHGQEALIANLTGHRNNAYGNFSQYTSTNKSDNCSFGTNSLRNNAADENCAYGNYSLFSNTAGTLGCAFGFHALSSNTAGSQNNAFGSYSLYGNTTGNFNAAFGHRAGYGAAGDEATSVDTYCTFLGPYASRSGAVPTATVLTNSTAVGNDAKVTKSDQMVLGNASVTETIVRGVIKGTALTFATLPTASSAGAGARSFITDCNSTTFAAAAAGGGANGVPVYSDGSTWRVG